MILAEQALQQAECRTGCFLGVGVPLHFPFQEANVDQPESDFGILVSEEAETDLVDAILLAERLLKFPRVGKFADFGYKVFDSPHLIPSGGGQ